MSDRVKIPLSYWVATIGVALSVSLCPGYCSAGACPYLECNPGYQYAPCNATFPWGRCEPCPAGHFMADGTNSEFPVLCIPFGCGEQAEPSCRLRGRSCPANEPQDCECLLDKGYHGKYPSCQYKNCPNGTKLSDSGDCLPHPSPHPLPPQYPLPGSSTTTHQQPNPKTSSGTTSGPSSSTQEGADGKDRETREDFSNGLGIEKRWMWLTIGIIIGIVLMIILGLAGVIGYILKSCPGREGSRGTGDVMHSSGTNLTTSTATSGVVFDMGREDSLQNAAGVNRQSPRYSDQETCPFLHVHRV